MTIDAQDLQAMIQQTIRDSIREILREERLALASRVSKREMEEIRSQCGTLDQDWIREHLITHPEQRSLCQGYLRETGKDATIEP